MLALVQEVQVLLFTVSKVQCNVNCKLQSYSIKRYCSLYNLRVSLFHDVIVFVLINAAVNQIVLKYSEKCLKIAHGDKTTILRAKC